ncbi:MAG TPA: RNA pseudouridine synthase [Myxococcota bacterium]|nr:RNA pseudouridine synthase [Myxococcota bacterium]
MSPRLLTRFDDHFYAFDKPAGMAVHANAEGIGDLVSWLRTQRSLPRGLAPAHRLDRGTSGVVLCGSNRKARATICDWLTSGRKTYLALVAGTPEADEGCLDAPLFDARRKRKLEARTQFRVSRRLGGFSLLEVDLLTGRKHQLRRHLADAGLPVVGDQRHGPKRPRRVPGFPGRLWLHSWRIELGARTITAPLPAELREHLDSMGQVRR